MAKAVRKYNKIKGRSRFADHAPIITPRSAGRFKALRDFVPAVLTAVGRYTLEGVSAVEGGRNRNKMPMESRFPRWSLRSRSRVSAVSQLLEKVVPA